MFLKKNEGIFFKKIIKIQSSLFDLTCRSIAVWDYSESKYWHPNLSDTIKRFVPSQITTPTFDHHTELIDFGRCVAIKSLPIATDTELLNGYNPKQVRTRVCG